MSSLAELPELVGFFSYSRRDDEHSGGALSRLRARIHDELRLQLGRDVRLWQDTAAIPHGTLWEEEIKRAIAECAFFLPIVTPSAVASSHCRTEFELFLAREAELGRKDLIFPILYIRVPALGIEDQRRQNDVLNIIHVRQYADWTKIRMEDVASPAVGRQIERFCEDIVEALFKQWVSPEERRRQEEEAKRVADAERRREAAAEAERQRLAEAAAKREAEQKAQEDRMRAEREERRRREEAEAQRRAEEEQRQQEEERRRKTAAEAERQRLEREAAANADETRRASEAGHRAREAEQRRGAGAETEGQREAADAAAEGGSRREAADAARPTKPERPGERRRTGSPTWLGWAIGGAVIAVVAAAILILKPGPPASEQSPAAAEAPATAPPAPARQAQVLAPTPPFAALIAARLLTPDRERALKPQDTFRECSGCPEMLVVPAGSFTMGSPPDEPGRYSDEGPQHRVTIAKSFAVSKLTLTFDNWDACVIDGGCGGYNPSDQDWGRGPQPVIYVSWDDAKSYVAWLSTKTGKPYRLLTEAEYEYATRAETQTAYWWGNDIGEGNANCGGCGSGGITGRRPRSAHLLPTSSVFMT